MAKKKTIATPWFKDTIIYELSVRAFYDSNGDGIGDFEGLIEKLDYLEDLGIGTVWLLPFYPSPLKDDGYDVTDYYDVHPDYGSLSDFKTFLKEAHQRGIKVITELVLNHTSDQHPWFRKARRSRQGSRAREFYVWSDSPEKYKEARVLFSQDEDASNWVWDTEAGAYYFTRFGKYLPELNYENPEVQLEIIKVADFWLKMGVDGLRLSCMPFLFEQEGTSCENLPQTHAYIKKLRAHIDKCYKDRVLVGEANLWPEEAVSYFGQGDECHMNFHYPLMPRLFLSLRTEDSFPIRDIIGQTPPSPENCQWALFLRNHDELGLEMVTDEEKDYLFKAYARDPNSKFNTGINRRLAPLLNNDRRKIELLYSLLFSLPGTPVTYYGDEIGMGDNVYLGGRSGVRTPMQWSMDLNAGFSKANPQKLFLPLITDPVYRHEFVNVATQEENHSSLVWWMKNIIAMRKRLLMLGRGSLKFIESSNAKVLSFVRTYEKQQIIVVANLSQFSQAAVINLKEYKGYEITEVFSQNRFANVEDAGYAVTLGPYGYFWLQADPPESREQAEASGELVLLESDLSWERLFNNYELVRNIERKILPVFMKKCRWFGGKAKTISKIGFHKVIPMKVGSDMHYLTVVEVNYVQSLPELYFIPMTFVTADRIIERVEYTIQSVICRAEIQEDNGFVIDSSYDRAFRDTLLTNMKKEMKLKEDSGVLEFNSSVFSPISLNGEVESRILKADQSNTAIIYNEKYFFKFYRKIEREVNPDMEITRFLSESTSFGNSPKYAGSIEYREEGGTFVFGLMQEKVEHQGDSWTMTIDSVGRFYERVLASGYRENLPKLPNKQSIKFEETPEPIRELIGRGFYERITRLGQRTAEMHQALASETSNPAFAPESYTTNYQRSVYSSIRKLTLDALGLLKANLPKLNPERREFAKKVLALEGKILEALSEVYKVKINEIKTRIHGDYHLGQVLFTGKDFIIIDFEGEPGLSFSERRLKRSQLKDVAGMMRSINYAAYGKILLNENYREKDREYLEAWARQWQHYVTRYYLGAYMEKMGMGTELPKERTILIRTFLLEKAVYELAYELNNRPDWVMIPLRGIYDLMSE